MSKNTNANNLTAEQKAALNFAIDMYALKQAKLNGGMKAKPVILMPQFEEDTDGKWIRTSDSIFSNTGSRPW